MKKLIGVVVSFLAGLVIGAVIVGLLAAKASKTYLEGTRLLYILEETKLADGEWRDGKRHEALIHYSNIVHAESEARVPAFDPTYNYWGFGFPFAAVIVGAMREEDPGRDSSRRFRLYQEGIARAELGLLLEELGKSQDAEREFVAASRLMGVNDIEGVKRRAIQRREARMAARSRKGGGVDRTE